MHEAATNNRYLEATINRILDDSAQPYISKITIFGGEKVMTPVRREWLRKMESEGVLRVLHDPDHAPDDEPFVEMLRYIGVTSPIPNFLNYEEAPAADS